MLSLFKKGQLDVFLEELSIMTDADFANAERMKFIFNKFDIYEAEWRFFFTRPNRFNFSAASFNAGTKA